MHRKLVLSNGSNPNRSSLFLPITCYSCMPTAFKEKWSFLKETYYSPANFTDLCNGEKISRQVETVRCFGPCVTLVESSFVGGHYYVRGCMDRIARKGFNAVTVRQMGFEQYDTCHKVMRSQLFRNVPYVEDQITMCTCFEDRCNSARRTLFTQVTLMIILV
ncbi:unnamed protein product [Soboliphyme baturini]|uniref:DUF5746 domain-containing protein n=1 Tax=Soboliphyme baturini TaxID=241478 RepID=A0A183IEZ5_9BILA|nr:unnamed protein product [Soboliphyme baturini]